MVRALQRENELKRINANGYHALFEVYLEEPTPVWDHAWELTGGLINAIATRSTEVDALTAVLIIPDRVQVHPEEWQRILDAYPGMKNESWDMDRPNRLLAKHLDRLGIPFFDPITAMRERAEGGERLYFHNDIHFNLLGNQVIGKLGGAFVAENVTAGNRSSSVSDGIEPRR